MADDNLYTDASAEDDSSDEESPSSSGASALTSDNVFPALMSAFSSQESSGNYSAENPRTKAAGKYQILPDNVRQWSKDILGKEVSPEQFKKSPEIQDRIAHAKLSEYYNSALSMTGGDPVEAAKLTANKWYTGNYNPKNDAKRPRPNEPSPAEYRAQLMGKLGLKLGSTIGTTASNGGAMQAPIAAPIVRGGKPFSLEDVFNDNQDTTQTQAPASTAPADTTAEQPAQQPSAPAPSADMLRWQGIVKRQQQIDAEKAKAPAPAPQAKQTTSFDPQTAAYKYAINGGLQKPVADNIPPVLAPKPGTEQPTFVSESTKQAPALTPEAFASQHAYRDKMAQEQAAQLGVPVRGSSGIYRPYVAPDGTKGSVLSSDDTESKIQDVQDEKTKQVQNAALSALGNTGVSPGSLLFGLASKSEVVKGIANVGVRAADLTLGGLPMAIAPKQMGALEEATTSTNPTARAIEQVAGTGLGIAGSVGAGAFKVAGVASESILGRLAALGAKNLVEKPAVGLATTLGLEAIPREAVKAATGQQTVGEAASQVGQAALSGAVLGGGGQVGSKLAEAAQAGRFGTTAIKAATGAATMSAVNVLTGNAPDLQSALLGAAMEGRQGLAEGAGRGDVNTYKRNLIKSLDKDNIIDHTVAAVGKVRGDTPVSGFAVGRADVVDAVKQAVDEGALLPADAMNSAVSKLHDKFGADIDKDKFIDNVGQEIDNRLTQPATIVAEDQTPVTAPKENVLAETPHVAAGGQYETDSPIIERQIKSGKNRGKIQRGVVATDLNEEQVQSITNRAPVKEGEGFFIPERYVKRPVSEETIPEVIPQVEPTTQQGQPSVAQAEENVPLETERTPVAEAQIKEITVKQRPKEEKRVVGINELPSSGKDASNTMWYHGASKKGLQAEDIDPLGFSKLEGLLGQGFYLTDDPYVAKSYAKGRGGKGGQVYEATVQPRNVINFDRPIPPEVLSVIKESVPIEWQDFFDNIKPEETGTQWYRRLTEEIEGMDSSEASDGIQGIYDGLQKAGYDAITHRGGVYTNKSGNNHKVLILIDPNGGRTGRITESGNVESLYGNSLRSLEPVNIKVEKSTETLQQPSQAESFERPLSNEDVRGGKEVQPADIIPEQPSEKEQTNAAQIRNEPANRVREHLGVASGSDLRSNEEEVRQSQSEQAGNRNRAFEEAGIRTGQEAPITQSADQETRQRIIDETNKKIYPESPNNPPIKAIRDYAIRNYVKTTDDNGKSLGWKQLLDAIHNDAIGKAARPITEDMGVARGEEARALSPMESAGTLQATVPLVREVAAEIKPKLESFVDWVRGVSSGVRRGTAPQTRITRISAEDVKPSDLHNTQFTYDGNSYKLKRERQADDSFRSEFYQNGKRVINPSDELRTKLTNAATKSYIDNARLSAQRSALLLRDISATQARAVAIKAKEVEDLRSVFAGRSDVDNHRLISDIMADRPLTDPIEQEAAQSIRKIFREQGQRIMDAGKAVGKDIHFDLRDTFFSLLWKDTSRARLGQVLNAKRPVGGTKYFMQKKVFQDIAEGIEKGLTPAYSNPFDFVMHYVAESERMIAGMNALKSLKDMGYGRIIKSAKFAPAGWERVEALEKFTKNREGQLVKAGEFYAPSGAAQVLNNYFSQGISGPFLGKTYAGWMHLNNHLNQLQLSLSGFHATFVTMESIMSRVALGLRESVYGISHGEKKFITQGVTKIATALTAPRGSELGKNVQTEWFKPGTTGDNMATMIADALMHGGYRGEMPREYQAGKPKIVSGKGALRSTGETVISPLKEAAKDIKDERYISATIGTGIRYLELPTRAILEKYVPHMKFMAATELAKFELERFTFEHGRDATPEEMRAVTEKVVNVIDDRFGELAYDNLFWNKTFKQTAMGLQRSVGWNYGVLRTIFGGSFDAVKNSILLAGKGLEKVSGGKYTQETSPEFTQRTAYVVAFPTVVAMIGSALNFTLTGEPPQDIKDMFFPRTGGTDEHGNPARISIPSYATDAYNLGKDILSEFGEGSSHLFRTIGHKISPAISFVADIKNNKDYYEREIIPNQVPWYEGAADIAKFGLRQFTPFSINQLSKITTEGGGARNVLPFFGVKPAPPSINRTAMQEFLSDKSAEQMSAGGRPGESVDQTQASRQIESLFRQGKTKEANDLANQKLREGVISPNHIVQARKDAQLPVRAAQLKHATDPNAMTAYFNVASDEERKQLAPEMAQKLLSIDLYNLLPGVARDYLNKFTEAELQGKTKYMDKNAAAAYKRGLTGYIQLYENNRLPTFNFSPVPAK